MGRKRRNTTLLGIRALHDVIRSFFGDRESGPPLLLLLPLLPLLLPLRLPLLPLFVWVNREKQERVGATASSARLGRGRAELVRTYFVTPGELLFLLGGASALYTPAMFTTAVVQRRDWECAGSGRGRPCFLHVLSTPEYACNI